VIFFPIDRSDGKGGPHVLSRQSSRGRYGRNRLRRKHDSEPIPWPAGKRLLTRECFRITGRSSFPCLPRAFTRAPAMTMVPCWRGRDPCLTQSEQGRHEPRGTAIPFTTMSACIRMNGSMQSFSVVGDGFVFGSNPRDRAS
jgi:hypothetical protein